MSSDEATCFVISPIGPAGSEIRKNFDRVFTLLLEPALEKYHFEVLRADHILESGEITRQVIELIQTAELCIVDLTGRNPNVYYECGRRHETSKPVIQIAAMGEEIPFDLATHRTIFYDLATPESVLEGNRRIQAFVDSLDAQGYVTESSGESLSSVLESMRRIERKLDGMTVSAPTPETRGRSMPRSGLSGFLEDMEAARRPVRSRIIEAIAIGDAEQAGELFRQALSDSDFGQDELILTASLLVHFGDKAAIDYLASNLDAFSVEGVDLDIARNRVTTVTEIAGRDDRVSLQYACEFAERACAHPDAAAADKAMMLNRAQMAAYRLRDYETALKYSDETLQFDRDTGAFYYNRSLVLEKMDDMAGAEEAIRECLRLDEIDETVDADHLSQAVDVFLASGREEDVRAAFSQLFEVDPVKARVKLVTEAGLPSIVG